jgi:hypothetical protein
MKKTLKERRRVIKYLFTYVCNYHIENYACEHSKCYTVIDLIEGITLGEHAL